MHTVIDRHHRVIEDPKLVQALVNDTRLAWLWLPVRLFLAYQWLAAFYGKLTNPAWTQTGDALNAFWLGALKVDPKPVIAFDWYRTFIQLLVDTHAAVWFSKVVMTGELAIGLGLLLGAFTGIAAFGGTLLNLNFMLAGSASTNPLLFGLATFLVLSWKVAGWYGLDRVLLPKLGVPWHLEHVITEAEVRLEPQPAVG
jgi:thiosulfate dehydrogenase [quinone] large subunit